MKHGRDTQCLATVRSLLFSLINDVLNLSRRAPVVPVYLGMVLEAILSLLPSCIPGTPEGWQLERGLDVQWKGAFVLVPVSRRKDRGCLSPGALKGERSSHGGALPVRA